jgi:hypothetical protein
MTLTGRHGQHPPVCNLIVLRHAIGVAHRVGVGGPSEPISQKIGLVAVCLGWAFGLHASGLAAGR